MASDADGAPRTYPVPIEMGKVREFARATGSQSASYLEDPAPPIPVTFLRTSAFWEPKSWASPMAGLDLNLRRILHGEEEFVFFGKPPRAGDTLAVSTRLESVSEKQGRRGGAMRVIVTVKDFTDQSGRLVAQSRSTLIETGKAPE
jgi:hypothetical protein